MYIYELAYHENNDPDGDTDDDIDVSIDLFGEDGPAALEVVVFVVGFRVRLTTLLQQQNLLKYSFFISFKETCKNF